MDHFSVSPESAVPLYHQRRQSLLDRVQAGDLKTGDPLPSQRAIASQLVVSRMTTPHALQSLCSLGVAYSRRGYYDPVTSPYAFLRECYDLGITVADETIEASLSALRESRLLRTPSKSPVSIFNRIGYVSHLQALKHVKSTCRAGRYKIVNRLRQVDFEFPGKSRAHEGGGDEPCFRALPASVGTNQALRFPFQRTSWTGRSKSWLTQYRQNQCQKKEVLWLILKFGFFTETWGFGGPRSSCCWSSQA